MKVRRCVETVIDQLVGQFPIEKVWACDVFHLTRRFIRKLLSHIVDVFLNMLLGQGLYSLKAWLKFKSRI